MGDHIATVVTQIPRNVSDRMKELAALLLSAEEKIACRSKSGESSRLKFNEEAPQYTEVDPGGADTAKSKSSFWKRYF